MSAVAAALVTYSAQVLIVVAVAGVAAVVVRLPMPAARLHYWRAVVTLCLLLPVLPDVRPAGPLATVTFEMAATDPALATRSRSSWVEASASVLPWVVTAGAAVRLLWLGAGAARLRRLRRRSDPAPLAGALGDVRLAVAPEADVRSTTELTQPVAFGWRRPIVLLPPHFWTLTRDAQRAVLCHELLHVRRRDWLGIVGEELVRTLFWFHPAMWWALDQVDLNREQVVDQLVMARTPVRRAYMDALFQFASAPGASRPGIAFLRRRHLASRLRQLSKEPYMTRRRLVPAILVLLFVVTGTAAAVLSALPLTLPALAAQGSSSLEVRLAETQPAPGLVEAVVDGSDRRVYLRPGSIVTAADVTGARVEDAGGRYAVNVTFTTTASNRLAAATKGHLGRPLAILLEGRVISAPTLRSMISGSAVITGGFTRAEAERIAAGLSPRGVAEPPRQAPVTAQDAGVTLPIPVREVKPRYTGAAMQARIQGDVELTIVVRADGTVDDVNVTKSLDAVHGLDEAAVDAARQWAFTPGTKDGQPADVLVHLNMRFTLK